MNNIEITWMTSKSRLRHSGDMFDSIFYNCIGVYFYFKSRARVLVSRSVYWQLNEDLKTK